MAKIPIQLSVNGDTYELTVEPWRSLVEVLREDLNLTGTKIGCQTGDCGACTVLMDGRSVTSCLVLAVDAQGREITTIEGVPAGHRMDRLQKAFVDEGAIQCG